MDSLRILVPTPMMGYGFPIKEFERGLSYKPHAIVLDAGSTDSGPQKLALGEMTCPASAYKKEMEILIPAAVKANVPLIITSAAATEPMNTLIYLWNLSNRLRKHINLKSGLLRSL
ncbi:hypothetical protein MGH68_15580 [Erysipelothrix sp. D19-032]